MFKRLLREEVNSEKWSVLTVTCRLLMSLIWALSVTGAQMYWADSFLSKLAKREANGLSSSYRRVQVQEKNFLFWCVYFYFILFLLLCCVFLGPHLQHMEVPRRGINQSCSCRPTPQLQQHQIWAESETYTTAHSNAGSLTCWVRPGIEPSTSWLLVQGVKDPALSLLCRLDP